MAKIYLVRHSQASFGKLNYDQLSDLGFEQGNVLGQALQQRGIEVSRVIHGDMLRHQQTMQSAQKHWHSYGSVQCMPGFNEFDSDDVIACAFPQFKHKAAMGAWLLTQKNKRKAFQDIFVQAIDRWIAGKHDDYQESWLEFTTRCTQSLDELINTLQGKDAVVFTSAGPIMAIAQRCLGLSHQKAFDLNWTLLNASLTQLLYNSSGKISLASCNEHHHLATAGSRYLTYR